ncbi:hypothetical protein PRZ48_006256 [Zasmidium cellare]|uniref:Uncharacterized protein n=1 Tax=Zasmidium cellare TaxID=395010 RepID=A0ABR0ENU0_ZASCE|nr:hypothetical protein PRZ48_006256 [Zasmidium cellare]
MGDLGGPPTGGTWKTARMICHLCASRRWTDCDMETSKPCSNCKHFCGNSGKTQCNGRKRAWADVFCTEAKNCFNATGDLRIPDPTRRKCMPMLGIPPGELGPMPPMIPPRLPRPIQDNVFAALGYPLPVLPAQATRQPAPPMPQPQREIQRQPAPPPPRAAAPPPPARPMPRPASRYPTPIAPWQNIPVPRQATVRPQAPPMPQPQREIQRQPSVSISPFPPHQQTISAPQPPSRPIQAYLPQRNIPAMRPPTVPSQGPLPPQYPREQERYLLPSYLDQPVVLPPTPCWVSRTHIYVPATVYVFESNAAEPPQAFDPSMYGHPAQTREPSAYERPAPATNLGKRRRDSGYEGPEPKRRHVNSPEVVIKVEPVDTPHRFRTAYTEAPRARFSDMPPPWYPTGR